MMHSSEWTLKYDQPEVENVARRRAQRDVEAFRFTVISFGVSARGGRRRL